MAAALCEFATILVSRHGCAMKLMKVHRQQQSDNDTGYVSDTRIPTLEMMSRWYCTSDNKIEDGGG